MRDIERSLGRAILVAIVVLTWFGGELAFAAPVPLPDWSGVWVVPETTFIQTLLAETDADNPLAPPLRPEQAAQLKTFRARRMTGGDSGGHQLRTNGEQCLPPGMPDVMRYPAGIEFLVTPGRVTMLLEEGPGIRPIYTDGRSHDRSADSSFHGESIGRWEGTTLVVDTVAISSRSALIGVVKTSGRAHVVERISRLDANHLRIETVVEDPGTLRAPWRYTRVYEKSATPFHDMVCLENNRDRDGEEPDLTPPSPQS